MVGEGSGWGDGLVARFEVVITVVGDKEVLVAVTKEVSVVGGAVVLLVGELDVVAEQIPDVGVALLVVAIGAPHDVYHGAGTLAVWEEQLAVRLDDGIVGAQLLVHALHLGRCANGLG